MMTAPSSSYKHTHTTRKKKPPISHSPAVMKRSWEEGGLGGKLKLKLKKAAVAGDRETDGGKARAIFHHQLHDPTSKPLGRCFCVCLSSHTHAHTHVGGWVSVLLTQTTERAQRVRWGGVEHSGIAAAGEWLSLARGMLRRFVVNIPRH